MTIVFGDQLSDNDAADFVEVSERRHQVVDVIGLGGSLLSTILFACPLLGVPIPTSIPIGLLIAVLGIFFVGRPMVTRKDLARLREFGMSRARAEEISQSYRRERALIRQGAVATARHARLTRALLASANASTTGEATTRTLKAIPPSTSSTS